MIYDCQPDLTEYISQINTAEKFFADMPNWECPLCGERANCQFDKGDWRWNGSAWEHSHGYPVGHVTAARKPQ